MKSIKSIVALFVLSLAFTTVSCDNEPVDPALEIGGGGSSTGDYWPTAINNEWLMERDAVALDPLKIVGTGNFGGQTYYKFAPQSGSGTSTSGTVTNWLNKSNGVYKLKTDDINVNAGGFSGTQTGYEFIILKDNIAVGQSWTGTYTSTTTYTGIPSITLTTNYTGTILAKNVAATVDGETYNDVIKVSFVQNTTMAGAPATVVNTEYWFAKNVGVIKSISNDAGNSYESILVDYTLF
ncbi:MAG: hypothetical protein ACOVNP_05145 [Flavobacterium sp.]